MTSLVFPFIRFCCENYEKLSQNLAELVNLSNLVRDMFANNILLKVNIKKIEERDFIELFRLYIESQVSFLKKDKERLKAIFIEKTLEQDLF